jgi:prevent-host-death family protein
VQSINIHQAKTHLSRLVDQAAKGDSFVIAKAGRPLVKVIALDAVASGKLRRTGFLLGQITVPDDFDSIGSDEIAGLFGSAS